MRPKIPTTAKPAKWPLFMVRAVLRRSAMAPPIAAPEMMSSGA